MNQRKEPNIEELLNSFIDGELTQREANEVKRLIEHDPQISQRLRELEKSKMLVGSLPRAEAPAEMLDELKASLEAMALPAQQTVRFDERAGLRHLLVRKVLATAAMIGLVAILAVVVYTIVVPEGGPSKSTAEVRVLAAGSHRRLELKASNVMAVNGFINKAIEDNILDCSSSTRRADRTEYALSCNREDLNSLMTGLGSVWEETKVVVDTGKEGDETVFDGVSAEQFAEIVGDLIPPKPGLTEDEPGLKEGKKVHLTIVVVGH
jgi:hypothetical protein